MRKKKDGKNRKQGGDAEVKENKIDVNMGRLTQLLTQHQTELARDFTSGPGAETRYSHCDRHRFNS